MEIAVTVALIAAAVALFAPLANHRLAALREKRARHAAACSAYRAAVLEALRGLYPEPLDWPSDPTDIVYVLEERFGALQAAAAAFRPYLPWWRRWQFDQAWDAYRIGPKRRGVVVRNFIQYLPDSHRGAMTFRRDGGEALGAAQAAFRTNVAHLLNMARAT
jgi:hypothetical protein